MPLPNGIISYEDYCEKVCNFLCKYAWVFDFKGTDILRYLTQFLSADLIQEIDGLGVEQYAAILRHDFQVLADL